MSVSQIPEAQSAPELQEEPTAPGYWHLPTPTPSVLHTSPSQHEPEPLYHSHSALSSQSFWLP